jgi:hypothetical protein
MLKLFVWVLGFVMLANTAKAEEIPFDINEFVENIKDVHSIAVQIDRDDDRPNMYWHMTLPQRYILAEKLMALDPFATLDRTQFLPYKDTNYQGVVVQAHTIDGDRFGNLRVFDGRITDDDGTLIRYDVDRALELWILGTTHRVEQKYVIAQTVPIVSFEQCKMLGNQIVETEPRQCLLTNGDILMEVKGHITEEVLSVNSFDECLQHGEKLIQAFPRKCVAAGGRVFMEQRRKNVGRELKEFIWE